MTVELYSFYHFYGSFFTLKFFCPSGAIPIEPYPHLYLAVMTRTTKIRVTLNTGDLARIRNTSEIP